MDKETLVEYAEMKEEIKDLRRRINQDKRELERLGKEIVSDSVVCGKKGKRPIRTVKVQGFASAAVIKKRNALKRKITLLELLETDLLEKQSEVEEYIQQIGKSELRIMFRLYFIDDLSYPKVALRMNDIFPKRKIKYTDENVKKRINRFLENVPQCPD